MIRPSLLVPMLWPGSALAVASEGAGHAAAPMIVTVGELSIPVITAGFAVIGVLAARPLSPRGNPPLSLARNILVTVILCLVSLFWVIESRPGLLFSFIVSIGLGFSGFAIIELAGAEVLAFLRRVFASINPKGGSQ